MTDLTIHLDVQRLIVVTGIPNLEDSSDALVGALVRNGLVHFDSLGMCLEVDENLTAQDAAGQGVPGLWALGPLVRGVFWECTAVPDIRVQAMRLARRIALQSCRAEMLTAAGSHIRGAAPLA